MKIIIAIGNVFAKLCVSPRATLTHTETHIMKAEITNVIEMVNNKVAKLAEQGMNEQAAFNAVMERMQSEYPEIFALLVNVAAA